MLTPSQFSDIQSRCFAILSEFVGKKDTYDLSPRIHVKLSPVYEHLLFEQNEKFRLDVSKESSCYYIDVMYSRETTRMREVCECIHTLKFVDGKFAEVTKETSK